MNEKTYRNNIIKSLITLAIPTLIEHILDTLMQYVDTAMVGQLGEDATAAVSTTTTVSWLTSGLPWAFAMAFMALISRAHGAGQKDEVKKYTGFAFLIAVIAGGFTALISCGLSPYIPAWMKADKSVRQAASNYFFIISLPYVFRSLNRILGASLRAIKDTKTPMRINLAANILNVILNSLFIYKLGYGVIGAAIASSISSVVAGLLMLVAVLKNSELRFTNKDIKPGKIRLNKTMEIALPALATGAASCLGYVAFARMVSGMGKTIFAAHSIAVAAEELFYMPGYGLRTATSALIGHALGEQDQKKMRQTEKVSIWINISIMVAGGILLFIFAEPMMRIFTNSDRVAILGAKMLRLVAFSEPFFGLMIVYEGIFYGKGQTKGIFVIETFSMWAVRIFFTYMVVNVWKMGLTEVWYCMIADNVFKALALMIYYNKNKNR